MGWFYSVDLRRRAVAATDNGTARVEVQRLFQVSRSTLARWLRAQHAGRSLEPKKGRPGFVGQFEDAKTLARLHRQLKAHPDERLLDHCRRWQKATGRAVSAPTMWRARARWAGRTKKAIRRRRARRGGACRLARRARRSEPGAPGLCGRERQQHGAGLALPVGTTRPAGCPGRHRATGAPTRRAWPH